AEFLAVGLSALVSQGTIDRRLAFALVTVAIGADAFSRTVRDVVLGSPRGLDLDLNDLIPTRIIDLERLDRGACVRGIQNAAVGLARRFQPGRAWATRVAAPNPPVGCPGDI